MTWPQRAAVAAVVAGVIAVAVGVGFVFWPAGVIVAGVVAAAVGVSADVWD